MPLDSALDLTERHDMKVLKINIGSLTGESSGLSHDAYCFAQHLASELPDEPINLCSLGARTMFQLHKFSAFLGDDYLDEVVSYLPRIFRDCLEGHSGKCAAAYFEGIARLHSEELAKQQTA